MRESWNIRGVSEKARLQLALISYSRNITIRQLIEELADKAWLEDDSDVHPKAVKKIKRAISRYEGATKYLTK